MWRHRKKSVNAEFEAWRADALARMDACLNFWETHEVFWEENRTNAVGIAHNLHEAEQLLAGIPYRGDDRVNGYRNALEAELTRIEANRDRAEAWQIMQEAAGEIVRIAREWISL